MYIDFQIRHLIKPLLFALLGGLITVPMYLIFGTGEISQVAAMAAGFGGVIGAAIAFVIGIVVGSRLPR